MQVWFDVPLVVQLIWGCTVAYISCDSDVCVFIQIGLCSSNLCCLLKD